MKGDFLKEKYTKYSINHIKLLILFVVIYLLKKSQVALNFSGYFVFISMNLGSIKPKSFSKPCYYYCKRFDVLKNNMNKKANTKNSLSFWSWKDTFKTSFGNKKIMANRLAS